MTAKRGIRRALRWVVGIFKKRNIPFQITGGLAASCYGSPRSAKDIDILIRRSSLPALLPDMRKYLTFGPARYRDRHFDVFMMTLNIFGTSVDIGMGCRIRNSGTGKWSWTPGLTQPTAWRRLWGLRIPLEPKAKLIRIKRVLGRKKDLEDIAAMRR